MSSQTSLVAEQVRLRQWAAQIQECQSRPAEEALEISAEQYAMLMQGLEIIPKHPIRPNDSLKRLM